MRKTSCRWTELCEKNISQAPREHITVHCSRFCDPSSAPLPVHAMENRSSASQRTVPVEIFYSYAHEDEELRGELEKPLALLRRHCVITDWHDRNIAAGTE